MAKQKVAIQGGGPNYLGKQPTVSSIPRKWKSSPDHPTAQLAYITDEEKDSINRVMDKAEKITSNMEKTVAAATKPNGRDK